MGRTAKKDDEDSCYQMCCLCFKKTSRNFSYITEYYIKKKKIEKYDEENMTFYDILMNLMLLSYQVRDAQSTIICGHCKKVVLEFFEFKKLTESLQEEKVSSTRRIRNHAEIDSIKKYLRSNHYDKLKTFIVNNIIESLEETENNELKLVPVRREIKTEFIGDIFSEMSFVDPNVMIKIEKHEDETELKFCDDELSDSFEAIESSPAHKIENNEDCVEDGDNSIAGNEEDIFGTDGNAENELGVTKTVVDNVQFISRIPECLVGLESKIQEIEKNTMRKPPNPKAWQRIIQRESRAKGKSYVSKQGKLVRARKIQAACKNCRFECTERVTEADRRKNFDNHWGLGDFALQKKFLFEHRQVEPVARRRKRKEDGKPRAYSTKYFLDTFNKDGSIKSQEKVCETMFCGTFDICKNNLRTLHKKVISGKVQDMRGQNRRKPTEGHFIAIDHVKQFRYFHIEQQMTIRQMYKDYIQICEEKGVGPVSENTFRGIFSSYNESDFLKADRKKVRCETCTAFYKATDEQKIAMQNSFDCHLRSNAPCKARFRWRKSGQAKKERRRLLREQKLLEQKQGGPQNNLQPNETLPTNTTTAENYGAGMSYY